MTDEIVTNEEKPARAPRKTAAKAEELPKNIVAIIPLIREELGAIAKDQKPEVGQKFQYRGHDQIVNAVAPLFNKYGVFTTVEDTLLEYGGRNAGNKYATHSVIAEKVTFYGPDGSSVSSTIVAESVDYGNKATGQAGTYAYRIALTKTFTIPTGDPDPDSRNEEFEATASAPQQAPSQPQAPAATDDLTPLRDSIKAHLKAHGIEGKDPVLNAGKTYFNGREGFWDNKAALTKWEKSLKAGEAPA